MSADRDAARMEVGPNALHEDDDGHWLECPRCGSPAYVGDIIRKSRCRGYRNDAEARDDTDRDPSCDASLRFELVWDDEE